MIFKVEVDRIRKIFPPSLHDISLLMAGNVSIKIIGICALMFYARVLSKEEMAIFPLYLMLGDLASLVFSFGILPSLIKLLPTMLKRNQAEARGLIITSGLIVISGTVIVSSIVFLFSNEVAALILRDVFCSNLIRVMTIGFIPLSVCKVAEHVMWASKRFGKMSTLAISEALIRPCCTVTLFLVSGIQGIVMGLVISQVVKALIAVFFIRDILIGTRNRTYPTRKLLRDSFPFYLESYLMYFRREGDNWLVSTMLGPVTLAVYFIAKMIYSTLFMIYSSIDQVLTERLARSISDPSIFSANIHKVHHILSQMVIPALFLIYSILPLLIFIVGGETYGAAVLPASILLIALLVQFLRIPISRSIFLGAKSKNRLMLTLIETLALFAALLFLTPTLGGSGVASARFFSQICGGLFGLWFLRSKMKITLEARVVVVSLISVIPGTILVTLFRIVPHSVGDVILNLTLIPTLWIPIFVFMVYMFDRQLFDWAVNKVKSNAIVRNI